MATSEDEKALSSLKGKTADIQASHSEARSCEDSGQHQGTMMKIVEGKRKDEEDITIPIKAYSTSWLKDIIFMSVFSQCEY
ncbi:Af4/Fmr2 Family Member 1 [Manis pentadactyla]|nr:Af4/Fmr2 Family Member 1 [Manis pentadactyla]